MKNKEERKRPRIADNIFKKFSNSLRTDNAEGPTSSKVMDN
jgi:hypothetical protein